MIVVLWSSGQQLSVSMFDLSPPLKLADFLSQFGIRLCQVLDDLLQPYDPAFQFVHLRVA